MIGRLKAGQGRPYAPQRSRPDRGRRPRLRPGPRPPCRATRPPSTAATPPPSRSSTRRMRPCHPARRGSTGGPPSSATGRARSAPGSETSRWRHRRSPKPPAARSSSAGSRWSGPPRARPRGLWRAGTPSSGTTPVTAAGASTATCGMPTRWRGTDPCRKEGQVVAAETLGSRHRTEAGIALSEPYREHRRRLE